MNPWSFYPNEEEVEQWVQSIWSLADSVTCEAEVIHLEEVPYRLGAHHNDHEFQYVKLTPAQSSCLDPFYAYWQPCSTRQAPLLVHVPGYGAEMSTHPELVAQGFHVLHICPLGYTAPWGRDESKRRNDDWPVLPDTVSSGGQGGYRVWLANCLLAVRWAQSLSVVLPNRVSFFGTSQGGGGALLLGSIYKGRGVQCVAADVPFLTNYPLADGRGAYRRAIQGLQESSSQEAGWKALGYIDTLSHASRLDIPVLLTAGGDDTACPPDTIQTLFERLPSTRSFTYLQGRVHRYTKEFAALASAWFRLYA